MDWEQLNDDLPVFIKSLMHADVLAVQWGDQPVTMQTGTTATLDLLEPEQLGVDDRVIEEVEVEGEPHVTETAIGAREMTLQVTVASQSQKLHKSARAYLEQLRTRLHWSSSIASLAALGLSLVSMGPVVEFDPIENSRVISKSALEIRVGYIHSETDAPAPFIETARVYSEHARNAAGTPLDASLQMDEIGPEI